VICHDNAVYWFDDCGQQGQKKHDCLCGCANQDECKTNCDCQPTDQQYATVCHDDAEYWLDDCENEGQKKTDCECGCDGDSCKASCSESTAPIILSFDTNIDRMDRYDELIFSAVVTDPDGIDDLIGGTLKDSESDSTYGAFVSTAQEGSYTLTISWNDIQNARPIYSPENGGPRSFTAEFYDQTGNKTEQSIDVSLVCNQDNSFAVCNGECADLNADEEHCGSCDNPISDPLDYGAYCKDRQKACSSGYDLCDDSGNCTQIYNNIDHCGSCGRSCYDYLADDVISSSLSCQDTDVCFQIARTFEAMSCRQLCAKVGMTTDEADICHNNGWEEIGCVSGYIPYHDEHYTWEIDDPDYVPQNDDWYQMYDLKCACSR
jgi:hypothetical protein